MGQLINLASFRKQVISTPTPALPTVDFVQRDQLRGTYNVEVFRESVGSGRHVFVVQALDAGVEYRTECFDKDLLKELIGVCRKTAAARFLMMRVKNDSGLPPSVLALSLDEIVH